MTRTSTTPRRPGLAGARAAAGILLAVQFRLALYAATRSPGCSADRSSRPAARRGGGALPMVALVVHGVRPPSGRAPVPLRPALVAVAVAVAATLVFLPLHAGPTPAIAAGFVAGLITWRWSR